MHLISLKVGQQVIISPNHWCYLSMPGLISLHMPARAGVNKWFVTVTDADIGILEEGVEGKGLWMNEADFKIMIGD